MNEYNERILKNVLEDCREEQTEQLKKEIEDAKNNPLFGNKEGEAEAFARRYTKKSKKKIGKTFLKVASILLVLAISLSFIPFTVEGRKSSVAEIIANFVNSEFIAFDSNEDDKSLLSYEGKFVPTFIPDGYSVESVINDAISNKIILSDSDNHVIILKEQKINMKTNIDNNAGDNKIEIDILGYKGMYFEIDGVQYVSVVAEDTLLHISCDDDSVDLIGFAKKIEKR